MIRTITFELEKIPSTCFECNFAQIEYCWATCPFLETSRIDGEFTPKNCPLKLKNKNKKYNFNKKVRNKK